MEVRALADNLLSTSRQVLEGAPHSLTGDGEDRAQLRLGHQDIDVLGLQSAHHGRLSARAFGRIEAQHTPALPPNHVERWPRSQLLRVESPFQDEAASNVPMKRPDVLLALCRAVVDCEVPQGIPSTHEAAYAVASQIVRQCHGAPNPHPGQVITSRLPRLRQASDHA